MVPKRVFSDASRGDVLFTDFDVDAYVHGARGRIVVDAAAVGPLDDITAADLAFLWRLDSAGLSETRSMLSCWTGNEARVTAFIATWAYERMWLAWALKGVGDYTARAVAVFAYGERHPVVDTNTRRVLARAIGGRSQPGPPSRRDLAAMEGLLPADVASSAVVNAATMELGATVCLSRGPRCGDCPVVDLCAWHAAGRPDTGDERRKQAAYEGSDRQARGAVLRALRHAPGHALSADAVCPEWPDPDQRARAIASLSADGLVEEAGDLLRLPA